MKLAKLLIAYALVSFACLSIGAASAAYIPATPQRSWQTTVTTGFNTTIPDGITLVVLNSSAVLGSGTLKMPANPSDGQPVTVISQKGVTLLSVVANTGQTITNGGALLVGANTPLRYKFSGVNNTWYPN